LQYDLTNFLFFLILKCVYQHLALIMMLQILVLLMSRENRTQW
jgi:hypothetical protein